jgi:hypothetical protein
MQSTPDMKWLPATTRHATPPINHTGARGGATCRTPAAHVECCWSA